MRVYEVKGLPDPSDNDYAVGGSSVNLKSTLKFKDVTDEKQYEVITHVVSNKREID